MIKNAFSKDVAIKQIISDGDHISKGTDIAYINGNIKEILTKEKVREIFERI